MTQQTDYVEVDVTALADGQMMRVDVGGRRVLLARVDGELHAIDAVCTHERAYLDEGALMGHVVYCPLHYSAFDVRSGEVLGPPADRSTQRYPVEVVDGKARISTEPLAAGEDKGTTSDATPTAAEVRTLPAERPKNLHSRMVDPIDRLVWPERLATGIHAAIGPLRHRLARAGLMDLLHGRWLGHALHPALSDLPIGLWAGSLLLHLVGFSDAAVLLGVVGIAAALAAAATGTADWTTTDGHERRVGLVHGLVMLGALLVQVGSVVAHFAGGHVVAVLLSAASIAVTLGAAYLGGHLVLGRGTMVDHTAWPEHSPGWERALAEDELGAGATVPVDVGQRKVLLHRDGDDRISAIEAVCSHAGAPLALGATCEGVVTCPWHDSRFRLRDGGVVRGPATFPQPALDVRVADGWIEVRSPRPAAPDVRRD